MKFRHRGDAPADIVGAGLVLFLWFTAFTKGGIDLWAVTAIGGWLSLVSLVFLTASYKQDKRISLPMQANVILLLFAALISSRFSFDINTTRLEIWICLFSGLAFYLFVNHFRDPSLRHQFLRYGGLIILPIALMALGEYLKSHHGHATADSIGLTKATFTNSAVLAGFALSWALIFWHLGRNNFLYRCLFAACLITLFVAQSWWSVISLITGFMYYYKDSIKEALFSNRIRPLPITALSLGLLLLASYIKLRSSAQGFGSITDRWNWWVTGIRMACEHPLVGVGLGSFGAAFPLFKPQGMLNTLYVHNFPIQILSETGLLGLVSALLLGYAYWRMLAAQKTVSEEFIAYRAAVVSILVFSLTSIYLDYFIGKLMLLMAMALTLCSIKKPEVRISTGSLMSAAAVLFLLVPSWYIPLKASKNYITGRSYEVSQSWDDAEIFYRKSLALNPYEDESYAGLSRIAHSRYTESHSVLDLSSSWLWSHHSWTLKKSHPFSRETPP